MATYLIVGGVAGGAGVAARLRRRDEHAKIIIFERGEHISFANCGLPYYAGGVIEDRSSLFVMTPELFKRVLDVEARVDSEVVGIDRAKKTITVRNVKDDTTYTQAYDHLILSPGATPIRPPIPGIDHPSIMTLRSVNDIDRIKTAVDLSETKRAVVIGGGFIGLEMAENLKHRGLEVALVEAQEQVMGVIDYDFAAQVQQHMRKKGVALHLKDPVKGFGSKDKSVLVELESGKVLETDLVILSIGVRPDTGFLKGSGIALSQTGAIVVDGYFTTSDPSIRALGDAICFACPLTDHSITIPLAGPANKQARLLADALIDGNKRPYKGTIGTSIAKVFDLTVASTGLTEKTLMALNLPHKSAVTHTSSHADYYPGSLPLSLKILFHPTTGKIWGAQAVGYEGVDKRIDVISSFIGMEGTVYDLAEFEHAYAPPFSSAKDPINMVGFIGMNALEGISNPIGWRELDELVAQGAVILDTRSEMETMTDGMLPGSINIPHTALRDRIAEVPRDKPIITTCV
ncbi:MAG: FAD-dependent oxidoreductase, partial [Spirochaetales bacterium]|nr:FAD-dependent oxidoreductase [Spirochaetales bacterium]